MRGGCDGGDRGICVQSGINERDLEILEKHLVSSEHANYGGMMHSFVNDECAQLLPKKKSEPAVLWTRNFIVISISCHFILGFSSRA